MNFDENMDRKLSFSTITVVEVLSQEAKNEKNMAWKDLQEKFRNSDKPGIHSLHRRLHIINWITEKLADIIMRSENLYYELMQLGGHQWRKDYR